MDSSGDNSIPASTFWCYECDMSVMLLPSVVPLACPNCRGGFLEEMESRHQRPQLGSPTGNDDLQLPLLYHASGDAVDDNAGESFDLDDDFIPPSIGLEPPQEEEDYHDIFDRLISRLVASSSEDYDFLGGGGSSGNGPRPASKSFVEAIPTIPITEGFLGTDRFALCAVCKEEFFLNSEAKQLPCNHVYHPDCILPWLSRHNSCPVCRFALPTEDREGKSPAAAGNPQGESETERHARVVHNLLRSFFPGNDDAMAEAENDLLDIGSMLRRVRRRRLSVLRRSRSSVAAGSSSARLSRAELGSEAIANSRERSHGVWLQDDESDAGGSSTVDADLGLDHFRF